MSRYDLTAEQLRAVLNYDKETGVFTRIQTRQNTRWVGQAAGSVNRIGYCYITVHGSQHLAHRLAMLYVNGKWPAEHVDHINGDPNDNRFCNLREVTHTENMQNRRRARAGSNSGLIGVHKKSRNAVKPWSASITVNRKKIHLGCFDIMKDAHTAYVKAKRELHPGGML